MKAHGIHESVGLPSVIILSLESSKLGAKVEFTHVQPNRQNMDDLTIQIWMTKYG